MGKKRLKRVPIDAHCIADLFAGDLTIVTGFPDDVTIDRVYEEPATQQYFFILSSEKFPVVEEGQEIPIEQPKVATRRDAGGFEEY